MASTCIEIIVSSSALIFLNIVAKYWKLVQGKHHETDEHIYADTHTVTHTHTHIYTHTDTNTLSLSLSRSHTHMLTILTLHASWTVDLIIKL